MVAVAERGEHRYTAALETMEPAVEKPDENKVWNPRTNPRSTIKTGNGQDKKLNKTDEKKRNFIVEK